jgi:hypothetical protein
MQHVSRRTQWFAMIGVACVTAFALNPAYPEPQVVDYLYSKCVAGPNCAGGLQRRCKEPPGTECLMCQLQSPQKLCEHSWAEACSEWSNPSGSDCGAAWAGMCEYIPNVTPGTCVDPIIIGRCARIDCL